MTADFMQQWEQFEHNSAPGAGSCSLNSFLPTCTVQQDGERRGLRESVAKMHTACGRMLSFTSGTSPEGLESAKLQASTCAAGSGGEKQSRFPGTATAVWLFRVSASCVHRIVRIEKALWRVSLIPLPKQTTQGHIPTGLEISLRPLWPFWSSVPLL